MSKFLCHSPLLHQYLSLSSPWDLIGVEMEGFLMTSWWRTKTELGSHMASSVHRCKLIIPNYPFTVPLRLTLKESSEKKFPPTGRALGRVLGHSFCMEKKGTKVRIYIVFETSGLTGQSEAWKSKIGESWTKMSREEACRRTYGNCHKDLCTTY